MCYRERLIQTQDTQEIDMAKQAKTKKSSTKIRANKRKAKLRGKEKRRRARSNKEA
jgi:hypothetical protein